MPKFIKKLNPVASAFNSLSVLNSPQQRYWTSAQIVHIVRKFRVRNWSTIWLPAILDYLNAAICDDTEDAILVALETIAHKVGCGITTARTILRHLETVEALTIIAGHGIGEDGRPHQLVNGYRPRRVIADTPELLTENLIFGTPAKAVVNRPKRVLRPQHRRIPMMLNSRTVETRDINIPLSDSFSPSELALMNERLAKVADESRAFVAKRFVHRR